MAELNALVVPEADILTLQETLYEQQQLLQQLNTDLDVEREASATAASEALSMILRLQGEKASLKMEANQYKRMAEEKICHTEEALAIFEDLIYQREMDIVSLEFQVQAYRYRLLSMGCNDLGVYETKFPENLLMQRNETLFGEKGVCNNVKRLNSLPQMQIKDSNTKRNIIDRRRSAITAPDSVNPTENSNQEFTDLDNKPGSPVCGDINFYWEQIKKVDERVKEISDNKDPCRNRSAIWKGCTWSPSLFSQVSIGTSIDTVKELNTTSDQVQLHQNFQEKDSEVSPSCASVQDIFEVPKPIDSWKACEYKNETPNLILEGENRLGKPDVFSEENTESSVKDKPDLVKAPLLPKRHENRIPKPRDGKSIDHNVSTIRRTTSLSQAEYQHLVRRIERLERARNTARQEITAEGEGLNLLKEIREQITSIQSEVRSLRTKKSPPPDEPSLDPLRDAMLYFWC